MHVTGGVERGNWGGFSFEIETPSTSSAANMDSAVATGAASRLRLKLPDPSLRSPRRWCGNWGGFSFEIETSLCRAQNERAGMVATGAASRLRLNPTPASLEDAR